MELSRKQRWQQLQSLIEPGFRRMLVISVLLHLFLPFIYNFSFFSSERNKPPVYRVNLINKPVKNPQAGRPEAIKVKKPQKPKAKPQPAPVKPKAKPLPTKPAPKPAEKPAPKPAKKPTPKLAPKPAPKPTVSKVQENTRLDAMAALQEKLNRKEAEAERQARLAALRAAAAVESQQIESPVADAPVGMLDGKGDEEGVAARAFVQEFIQQQWTLSKHQVTGNPEAEAILFYNAAGKLLHYRFVKKSGNTIFDESLTKAINKAQQLNQPLPEQMEFHIVFNLKEMLNRP